ncbi:hypothetical protein HKX48_005200 [Thoreauomyces humboldtii]|nr:hypothetical protein HKX48_005200 [Thoreauomyces humboldtii]
MSSTASASWPTRAKNPRLLVEIPRPTHFSPTFSSPPREDSHEDPEGGVVVAHDAARLPEQDFISLILHQNSNDDVHELCRARLDYLIDTDDARKMQRTPFWRIAMYRFPAIMLTLCLELVVAAIIDRYTPIRTVFPLLSAFFPVLSSISGNVGLQASTTTLRALATGHASNSSFHDVMRVMLKEFLSALMIAIVAGIVLTGIGLAWSGSLAFGLVTGFSILVSSSCGGIIGSTGPLLFKKLGIDPALTAGPFETAVQDMVGVAVYLGLANAILG